MPATTAAGLLALVGLFDVAGTIFSGWLTDRYDPRLLLVGYYTGRGLSLLALPALLSPNTTPSTWVFILFYGLDWVATVPPTVALCRAVLRYERADRLRLGVRGAPARRGGCRGRRRHDPGRRRARYDPAFYAAAALCAFAAVVCLRTTSAAAYRDGVKYNRRARLDTSQVRDTRRGGKLSGGSGIAVGGGGLGVVGVLIYVLVSVLGNGGSGSAITRRARATGQGGGNATADNSRDRATSARPARTRTPSSTARSSPTSTRSRRTGRASCRSWAGRTPRCRRSGSPARSDRLRLGDQRRRAVLLPRRQAGLHRPDASTTTCRHSSAREGGLFVDAYVLAHEYGHHVQDLLGTESKVQGRRDRSDIGIGATGTAGRLLRRRVGAPRDDRRPTRTGSRWSATSPRTTSAARWTPPAASATTTSRPTSATVGSTRSQFTHGSSKQREKWFSTGYRTGDPDQVRHVRHQRLG